MKKLYVSSFMAVSFGAIVLQACGTAESSPSIPSVNEAIPVKVLPLKQEAVSQPVTVSGQFITDDETTLSFKTGGVVNKVLVKEGDYVKKRQLLATLDLTEINAQVNQAELGYEKAERDFARAENLYADSVATLEQFQNARTAMSVAEQQLAAAKFNLGFSEIRASANGYVLKKYVNAGQVVAPGASIIRTNGAGNSGWIFKTGVSDKDWVVLQEGDSALIVTDAAAGNPIQGRISRKAEGADPSTGAFMVEIKAEAPDRKVLASGLFGTATIYPAAVSTAWKIPHEALLDANASKGYVFVTSDHKTAQKVEVTISHFDHSHVFISAGLENAGSLITTGSAYLTNHSPVSVLK